MLYSITKVFKVSIGHRLSKHRGLCKNIHGHNLKIEIKVSSNRLGYDDMVMDFSDLKAMVNDIMIDLDHSMILNPVDQNNMFYFTNEEYKTTFIEDSNTDPTAEVLSKFLYKSLETKLNLIGRVNCPKIQLVKVCETDTSFVEYSE